MTPVRRLISLVLLAISLGILCLEAPWAFAREAWFLVVMLGITFATRTASWRIALSALGLGIGIAAPAMIASGWLLAKAGLDVSEGGIGSWGFVPILEELVKLSVVALAAWFYRRRSGLAFNPSDWLLAGCAVGAGFAMVENAQLVSNNPGAMRDMARQYGPSWLVPGAWGVVGFVGHAAATGMAAAGIGVWSVLRRVPGSKPPLVWAALVAPFAWITIEHALANLRVDTGSDAALLLGNGRLTPWLFLAFAAFVVYLDYARARCALANSRKFRERAAAIRALVAGSRLPKTTGIRQRVLVAVSERRLLNAAALVSVERLCDERTAR
jgi:RsiW-degrading membrane proteinase PrsW (M82 family)